jgi:anhydro-N-acetylmuramic acid kinase
MKQQFTVLGLMSGTSLDGLDMALCCFTHENQTWSYEVLAAQAADYQAELRTQLASAMHMSGFELTLLHTQLGEYFGEEAKKFLANKPPVDFISSHGHTIFHRPDLRLTLQIGSASHIAAKTNVPVISDFRTGDVARGGQGAPLVPIGDKLLFGSYHTCLNLGGFANISFDKQGQRIAFDLAPCNLPLNIFAQQFGYEYDPNGRLARSGNVHQETLQALNALPYYHKVFPKSLGREFVEESILPTIQAAKLSAEDALATLSEHSAMQIAKHLPKEAEYKVLITGGGALNSYLIERIGYHAARSLPLPDKLTIQFKEAIVFAFLGVLRHLHLPNALASVTGSKKDHCGGTYTL